MISILPEKRGNNEAFVVSDGNEKLAECEYSADNSEILNIVVYKENNDLLRESVLRAALSRLDYAGKTDVTSKNPELDKFLTGLGFKKESGVCRINTTEFFKNAPCKNSNDA
jgi:hypothetical protein